MNICFITNELHPFKPGGIGRLMYNFAVQNRDRPTNRCNFFFLVAASDVPDTTELEAYYEKNNLGVVVRTPDEFSFLGKHEAKLFKSIPNEYNPDGFIRKSIEYYNGLLYLEAKYNIKLDVIEFPDYGGWGFTTLSAKRAGRHFLNTRIVVRLHSTAGLIQAAEPFYHRKGAGECAFSELERQCIEQADSVVSHLSVITDANQSFYCFGETWRDKVIHEFPPIFLDEDEVFTVDAGMGAKDFIFSSRLQPFKRPDLFIKAAIIFLDRNVGYTGKFFIVSYGWDKKYIGWLVDLVPERHRKSVLFIFSADAGLRNRLLQQSIVVIPSNYESLCVFAYESALRGSNLILNRDCLAFGKVPYWEDGKNCLFFDGDAEDLANAYDRALATSKPGVRQLPESLCFWHKDTLPEIATLGRSQEGTLAVIAYGGNTLAKANEKLFELSGLLGNPKLELHLIVNVKYAASMAKKLPENVKIHFCSWDTPSPSFFKALLGKINVDYVAFSLASGHVLPEFYTQAQKAFSADAHLGIVTSHVRKLFEGDLVNQRWQEGDRDDYGGNGLAQLTVGGAPSLANLQINVVSEFSCIRLSAIDCSAIQEESGDFFLPLLLNKAIRKGEKVLVMPNLYITQLPQEKAYLNDHAALESAG